MLQTLMFINWLFLQGQTPSDLTGPDGALTGENYIYAEGSSPRTTGQTAILISDINFPGKYWFSNTLDISLIMSGGESINGNKTKKSGCNKMICVNFILF